MMPERSRIILAPESIVEAWDDPDEPNDEELHALTEWLHLYNFPNDGDCVYTHPDPHRNDGKYLWDAKNLTLIPFESDLDDYGCIPKEFELGRFPLHYFADVLDHNDYVRLSDLLIFQIVQQATFGYPPKESGYGDEKVVWSKFFLHQDLYYVIGMPEDCHHRENEILGSTEFGALIVRHNGSDYEPLDPDSLEYAVNFMRMFISNVKDEQVKFRHDGKMHDRVVFVHC